MFLIFGLTGVDITNFSLIYTNEHSYRNFSILKTSKNIHSNMIDRFLP